jgi:hypothetical protein
MTNCFLKNEAVEMSHSNITFALGVEEFSILKLFKNIKSVRFAGKS